MTLLEKHITFALAVSALLVVFNIIAVTNGSAEVYYSEVEQFINHFEH